MKRLKKKANNDLNYEMELALVNLVFTNDGSSLIELYNEIDNDCFYNGTVYRILYLNDRELIENIKTQKDEMGIYVKCKDLIYAIQEKIETGDWQSTTKSYDNINSLGIDVTVSNPISVVIKFNCKNGIDLNKLSRKCLNDFKENNASEVYIKELNELVDITKQQEEVYAKIPSDYEIVSISDISINEFTGTVNIINLELE
ncbi:MAG: hypothetical protein SOZ95_06710 [Bacilli bacterium]|nr:hypothetical protein [Bacilli bacterium]